MLRHAQVSNLFERLRIRGTNYRSHVNSRPQFLGNQWFEIAAQPSPSIFWRQTSAGTPCASDTALIHVASSASLSGEE
jgi:hypothetical protein